MLAGELIARRVSVVDRHAAARGLHADEIALRGRNANGALAVGGVRNRHDAGGDRARRAAGRSAGGIGRVERIAARAEEAAFRRAGNAEFRRVGFAEDNQAGGLGELRVDAVLRADFWTDEGGAVRHGHARDRAMEILDQKRHALKGAVRQRTLGLLAGHVRIHKYDRIQRGIALFDARERLIGQFARRRSLCAHQLRQSRGVRALISAHRRLPYDCCRSLR